MRPWLASAFAYLQLVCGLLGLAALLGGLVWWCAGSYLWRWP